MLVHNKKENNPNPRNRSEKPQRHTFIKIKKNPNQRNRSEKPQRHTFTSVNYAQLPQYNSKLKVLTSAKILIKKCFKKKRITEIFQYYMLVMTYQGDGQLKSNSSPNIAASSDKTGSRKKLSEKREEEFLKAHIQSCYCQ